MRLKIKRNRDTDVPIFGRETASHKGFSTATTVSDERDKTVPQPLRRHVQSDSDMTRGTVWLQTHTVRRSQTLADRQRQCMIAS